MGKNQQVGFVCGSADRDALLTLLPALEIDFLATFRQDRCRQLRTADHHKVGNFSAFSIWRSFHRFRHTIDRGVGLQSFTPALNLLPVSLAKALKAPMETCLVRSPAPSEWSQVSWCYSDQPKSQVL